MRYRLILPLLLLFLAACTSTPPLVAARPTPIAFQPTLGRALSCEPVNDTIVRQLLALQGEDGGFAAHYTANGPADDADTETTAIALLAPYALRQLTE